MTKMASAPKHLQCVIVTPERAVLDETCDSIVLPLYDGELGVLPARAPLIGRLGYGELRIRRGTDLRRYYVDGGFAQVRLDVVTVLTQKAIRAEDIDTSKAAAVLQSPPADGQAARQKAQERARAQLRVARRGRGAVHTS
jgi:F-type H+-transporting ATPase subunit epsilon